MSDCWNWEGASLEGYGIVRRKGKAKRVYRMFWQTLNGEVPRGLELDHLCRNKKCVRPSHLQAVTHRENVLRGNSPSAVHARKITAKCGHPYTAHDGLRRYCKPCRTKWHRNYYRKNSQKVLLRQRGYRHAV